MLSQLHPILLAQSSDQRNYPCPIAANCYPDAFGIKDEQSPRSGIMIWDSFGIRGGPIPKDQESGIGINLGLEVSQFLEHELII